eukprot:3793616-Amphidinium_carterae.1
MPTPAWVHPFWEWVLLLVDTRAAEVIVSIKKLATLTSWKLASHVLGPSPLATLLDKKVLKLDVRSLDTLYRQI